MQMLVWLLLLGHLVLTTIAVGVSVFGGIAGCSGAACLGGVSLGIFLIIAFQGAGIVQVMKQELHDAHGWFVHLSFFLFAFVEIFYIIGSVWVTVGPTLSRASDNAIVSFVFFSLMAAVCIVQIIVYIVGGNKV